MRINNKQKGFTLIEILVSVAIFSIVLVAAMGAILTVLDANRKARTVVEVMNNLNFAMESITRTVKTGINYKNTDNVLSRIQVEANDLGSGDFTRENISYRLENNQILRCVNDIPTTACTYPSAQSWIPLTSEEAVIEELTFKIIGINCLGASINAGTCGPVPNFDQPRVLVNIRGRVEANNKIYSNFNLQTTISQRELNIQGIEL